jgi:type I restriction enzyme, S subunit
VGVRAGYKKTDLGVIPAQWDVTPLGDLFRFQNGVNADKGAYGRGVPFINVLEVITHSTLSVDKIPGRVSLPAEVRSVFEVAPGDVLFNRTSETQEDVALAAVYLDREPVVFGGFVIRGRPRGDCLDPLFSSYALRSSVVRRQLVARGQGAIRANIGHADLAGVSMFVPEKSEQAAIAETLSDADGSIEALRQLLAKKRQIQRGAAQELLTGRRRLPEFGDKRGHKNTEVGLIPNDWDVCPIGKMGEVVTGKALAVSEPGRQRPYLRTKNVFDGQIDIDDVLTMPMNDQQFEHFQLRRGDVLLNEGQSLEFVGRCAIYQDEYPEPCAIQNQLLRFRAYKGVSAMFASHLFRSCQRTGVFSRIALQTTSIAHLGGSRFERLRLAWPASEHEQQAIATVLTDMESEIAAAEEKLAKARRLKQGMMQELLTGRTRLL